MSDFDTTDSIDTKLTGTKIGKYRKWFREAVDGANKWRKAAQEDYDFVAGKQWTDGEKKAFEASGRPSITINRIKPLINVLSGYQRLNRYDIEFLPRTGDDVDICQVRKGITKYVLDRCDYDSQESAAFLDAAIGGLGWLDVSYEFDEEVQDGEARVKREDPFSIYVDPESHKPDFSDAKYICRGKWVDKDELISVYPEHKEEIEAQYAVYDSDERESERQIDDPMWYKADIKKVRLVECWYKRKKTVQVFYLQDGSMVTQDNATVDMFLQGLIVGQDKIHVTEVRVCSFFDTVLLEDIESPYEHGEFPLVPITCYAFGMGDLPAGFVRDLKDPQREINRRRIQVLHILNTSGTKVYCIHWLCANFFTPVHKLVETELVCFYYSPRKLKSSWSVFFRANAVFPIKCRYKITARISYDWNSNLFNKFHYILTISIFISKFITGLINTFIYSSPKMLDK